MFGRIERSSDLQVPKPQRGLRVRWFLVKISILLFFILIAWRLAQIQVVEASKFQEIARRQYESRMLLPASKGNICDRNGDVLVSNSMFISYAADPKIVRDEARRVAGEFSRFFGKPTKFYLEKLRSDRRFVWLVRRMTPDFANRFKGERFDGVMPFNEPKRLYHYGELAGQLLGFTDIDNKGISGLELQYDKEMRGKDGYVILQKDGLGNRKVSVGYPRVEAIDGATLHLTIDLGYQSIAEEELERGVKRSNADGGLVVAMNPRSGEILILAQYPGVNPSEVSRYDVKNQRLSVVTDMVEPASVFKLVTASAGLEGGLIKPDEFFFAENGKYKVPLRTGSFRIIKDTHPRGWMTFGEAMEISSNIVMAKASDIIGKKRLYRKAKEFGFGSVTGIDLPGEIRGELKKPSSWSVTTLNTMAYGYEVGVTPIQLLAAYGAVANGGLLVKPFVVKKIVGAEGAVMEETEPQVVRRVVTEEIAQTLTKFFEGAVERGTATHARIEGVRIAGKTGTSRKYVDGRYEPGSYLALFIGFFPADDPKFVCLTVIDQPRNGSYFGSQISAPIFRAIAERIISTSLEIPQGDRGTLITRAESSAARRIPNVCNVKVVVARRLLAERGIKSKIIGEGDMVLDQTPEPGTRVREGETVTLFLTRRGKRLADGYVETPELRGLSLRRALNRLAVDRLLGTVNGSGIVIGQTPSPGEKVKVGTKVSIRCEPRRSTTVAAY